MSNAAVEVRPHEEIRPRLRRRLAARVEEIVVAREDLAGAREKLRSELEGHWRRVRDAERALGASTLDGSGVGQVKRELGSAREQAEGAEAALAELDRRQGEAREEAWEAVISAELPPRAEVVSEGRLHRDEMVEILEEIIRDPETNSTARCTAIRTLLDIKPPEPSSDAWAALDEASPLRRRGGRTGDRS